VTEMSLPTQSGLRRHKGTFTGLLAGVAVLVSLALPATAAFATEGDVAADPSATSSTDAPTQAVAPAPADVAPVAEVVAPVPAADPVPASEPAPESDPAPISEPAPQVAEVVAPAPLARTMVTPLTETTYVAWRLAEGSSPTMTGAFAGGGQPYVGENTDLAALLASLPQCGADYQVDEYPKWVVAELKADGALGAGEDAAVVLWWKFVDNNACVTPVTVVAPHFTPGTCTEGGYVQADDTPDYGWDVTGPAEATVYTAVPNEGVPLTGQITWTYNIAQLTGEQCTPPPTPVVCEEIVQGGTVTNLDLHGWTVSNGTWTEDGLRLNSDNWVDATVSKSTSFNLSAARSLALDMNVSGAGNYGLGIVLHTSAGDLHWEDVYTDEFWSYEAVLPPTGGGQGGPYSGSLDDALATIGDLTVTSVTVVFSSATPNSAILNSATFNCFMVPFEYVPPTSVTPVLPVWIDECGPDNGHWSYTDTSEYGYTEKVNSDGSVTVTVSPKGWVAFPKGMITSWTEKDSNAQCPVVVTPVTPTVTPQVAVCTADYQVVTTSGTATIPVTTGGRYLLDGKVVSGVINLAPGTYTFAFEVVSTEYNRSDTVVDLTVVIKAATSPTCVKPPVPPAPPALASTGSNSATVSVVGGLLMLVGGFLVFVASSRRRRNELAG